MKYSRLLILFVFICGFATAKSFKVSDVRVDGLQRITAGSFFNYLPVRRGDVIDEKDFPLIIRQLYQTAFFDNINLYRDNNVLVVEVEERPIIGEVNFEGNKDLSDKILLQGSKSLGLGVGDTFDKTKLKQLERELLNLYYGRSKFDVIITTATRPLNNNRLALDITIQEGISARIKQINIVGNKAFSEKTVLNAIKLSTSKWHSLLTKGDQYSGEKLRGDIDRIEAFYLDRGYLDFKVNSTQVSLTDDKKYVYITVNISEGLPYRVYGSTFSGNTLLKQHVLSQSLKYGVGDYYSRQKVRESQQLLQEALGDKGYAFANVQVIPKLDRERQEVTLQYHLSPGKKTYVRRVEFRGNYKTNDEVLRREMRQMEAAVYNHTKLQRSNERLLRLKYITSVKRTQVPVKGKPDQVDIVYEVVETPSRNFTAGIGYGSSSGVLFNLGYESANFLGTGNAFAFDFGQSDTKQSYSLSFTDPYYTLDGISRSFSLYYTKENEDKANIGDWSSDNWGAFVRYGFPVNEAESFRLGAGYRGIKINTGDSVSPEIPAYLAKHGERYDEFVLDFHWTHDTRDQTIFSNSGAVTRFKAELVTPGSSETYYKLSARNRTYFRLGENLLTSVRGDISYGDGYGDTEDVPFFRHYYAGGLTTVRGFKTNTLGPKWSNGDKKGGDLRVTGGAEIIFPWHLGQDAETVRLGAFLDFGNVYNDLDDFDASDFRYSTGLYVLWRSPIGPLNLSYGIPLNEKEGDELEKFQFTVGVPL